MGKTKDIRRMQINKAASNFLSDQEDGDLFDAYIALTEEDEKGNGKDLAANYVTVWEKLDSITVEDLVNAIECAVMNEIPAFINRMDWNLLRDQKLALNTLLSTKVLNETLEGNLEGILNTIDAVQDYAVDVIGIDEELVFGESKQE
jgi:hypothetical protein